MFPQALLASEEVSNIVYQNGNLILTNEITTMWGVMIVLIILLVSRDEGYADETKNVEPAEYLWLHHRFPDGTIEGIMGKENAASTRHFCSRSSS